MLLACFLTEERWERFDEVLRAEAILIGAPTLFETYRVKAGKGFVNARAILEELSAADNVSVTPFSVFHFHAAREAFDRFGVGTGGGREASALNIFDCMIYAAAHVSDTPLLFKGDDFQRTDLRIHPASQRPDGTPHTERAR